jgi:hypothetical protein
MKRYVLLSMVILTSLSTVKPSDMALPGELSGSNELVQEVGMVKSALSGIGNVLVKVVKIPLGGMVRFSKFMRLDRALDYLFTEKMMNQELLLGTSRRDVICQTLILGTILCVSYVVYKFFTKNNATNTCDEANQCTHRAC